MSNEMRVDYDVVSEFAGHKENRGVVMKEAVKDIYSKVKTKAMQAAVKGHFISIDSEADLERQLTEAVGSGFSIRLYDEDIGG